MRDAFAAWKAGIPAVVLVHEPFATLAKTQCQVLGAKDPIILVYKQDAPARTPPPIINRLHKETVQVLNTPDVKEKLQNAGVEVIGDMPDQLAARVRSEMLRIGKVIKDAGIRSN